MKKTGLLYTFIGKSGFALDPNISKMNIARIFINKCFELMRGLFYSRLFFKNSSGLVFIGKRINFSFAGMIITGPTLSLGNGIKINALSKNGVQIGRNVTLKDGVIIDCCGVLSEIGEGIKIGNNVGVSENVIFQVRGQINIEDDVIIGPGSVIVSENHNFSNSNSDLPIRQQGTTRHPINIGKGAWIGAKTVIISGANIGSNSIIAAGAVVNCDVPPNTIFGGVPAKFIKNINE